MKIEMALWIKIWVPFIQVCFVPCLIEIGPLVPERGIFSIHYNPLEKGMVIHLNIPHTKGYLMPSVWLKLALWFLRGGFLKFLNAFSLFHYHITSEMYPISLLIHNFLVKLEFLFHTNVLLYTFFSKSGNSSFLT